MSKSKRSGNKKNAVTIPLPSFQELAAATAATVINAREQGIREAAALAPAQAPVVVEPPPPTPPPDPRAEAMSIAHPLERALALASVGSARLRSAAYPPRTPPTPAAVPAPAPAAPAAPVVPAVTDPNTLTLRDRLRDLRAQGRGLEAAALVLEHRKELLSGARQ